MKIKDREGKYGILVLIETLWNVNTIQIECFATGTAVLIETLWNVNTEGE